ncbi:MAG: relaxase [Pseudomonadota bacterium]
MILKGSQRAGAKQLAHHLLNTRDNDHVTVHEVSGFVTDDVVEAFHEAYAISRATRCKQYLFSLSFNPPPQESVSIEAFEDAIAQAETRLGLSGQPRAIILHEKEGRRHAHCVWSRIDVNAMKAVHMSHFKRKLTDLSRELYLEHGWQLPPGLKNKQDRDPMALSLAEWQQAKRAKADPREIKQIFQECWEQSDGRGAFQAALAQHCYTLARGDRRGHVAVDRRGEVYAVSKWVGVKARQVRDRLGPIDSLPSVDDVKSDQARLESDKLKAFAEQVEQAFAEASCGLMARRAVLVTRQRETRRKLREKQERRKLTETQKRAAKLPTGLRALWFRLTGRYAKVKAENEREFEACRQRERDEWQKLIDQQLSERRQLKAERDDAKERHRQTKQELTNMRLETKAGSPDAPTTWQRSSNPRRRRRRQPG